MMEKQVQKSALVEKAESIMRECEVAYVGKVDSNGYPRVSTISSLKVDDIGTMWFSTGLDGDKAKLYKSNPKASVCYNKANDNITLTGTMEVITEQEIKTELWVDWFINHFPGGPTDPNYCILKFTAGHAVLWVDRQVAEMDVI